MTTRLEAMIQRERATTKRRELTTHGSKWREATILMIDRPMTDDDARKFLVGMIEDNERLEAENDQLYEDIPLLLAVAHSTRTLNGFLNTLTEMLDRIYRGDGKAKQWAYKTLLAVTNTLEESLAPILAEEPTDG